MLNSLLLNKLNNGDGEIRTLDPLLARQVLSQLSYTPIRVIHLIEVLSYLIILIHSLHFIKQSKNKAALSLCIAK